MYLKLKIHSNAWNRLVSGVAACSFAISQAEALFLKALYLHISQVIVKSLVLSGKTILNILPLHSWLREAPLILPRSDNFSWPPEKETQVSLVSQMMLDLQFVLWFGRLNLKSILLCNAKVKCFFSILLKMLHFIWNVKLCLQVQSHSSF